MGLGRGWLAGGGVRGPGWESAQAATGWEACGFPWKLELA